MRIAVAGGTGLTGSEVVAIARSRGHDVVVISRSRGVDLLSGSGLRPLLRDVQAVVDVSNTDTLRTDESVSFFAGATRTLLAAGRAAGVAHHIALSIVGADAVPEGYYAGKLTQERLVAEGPVPWTIQRATQFHEFAALVYARATLGPIHLAPRARTQPIAVLDVARRLVDLAEGQPLGRATDVAGPREESLAEMVRSYARAIGHRGFLPSIPLPGALGRAQRSGALLPGPEAILARQTFDEWLEALPEA